MKPIKWFKWEAASNSDLSTKFHPVLPYQQNCFVLNLYESIAYALLIEAHRISIIGYLPVYRCVGLETGRPESAKLTAWRAWSHEEKQWLTWRDRQMLNRISHCYCTQPQPSCLLTSWMCPNSAVRPNTTTLAFFQWWTLLTANYSYN